MITITCAACGVEVEVDPTRGGKPRVTCANPICQSRRHDKLRAAKPKPPPVPEPEAAP